MKISDMSKDFFMKACKMIQYASMDHEDVVFIDIKKEYLIIDGKRSNWVFTLIPCEGFSLSTKDVVDFCYECLTQGRGKWLKCDSEWGFDGENIHVNRGL